MSYDVTVTRPIAAHTSHSVYNAESDKLIEAVKQRPILFAGAARKMLRGKAERLEEVAAEVAADG
jgi:hypothetical protein